MVLLVTPLSVWQAIWLTMTFLRHAGQLAGQVARVGGLQSGIGQTLAGAVGGGEVFEHRKAFAEVGLDGGLDDGPRRLGHEAAHAAELANLIDVAAGAGDGHHGDGIEILEKFAGLGGHRPPVVIAVVALQAGHEIVGDLLAGVAPHIDELGVSLLVGDGAHAVVLLDLVGLLLAFIENRRLAVGRADVGDAEAEAGERAALEAQGLHVVEQLDRRGPTEDPRTCRSDHAAPGSPWRSGRSYRTASPAGGCR